MASTPDLTVKEKTLIYLYENQEPEWGLEVSEKITQKGLARAVDVSRSHISQTLISLEKEDYLESRKARIEGHKRKKKAYKLLPKGRKEAKELYDYLMKSSIVVVEEEGEREISFKDALEEFRYGSLELYNELEEGRLVLYEEEEVELEEEEEKETEELEEELEELKEERRAYIMEEYRGKRRASILGIILVISSTVSLLLHIFYDIGNYMCFYSSISVIVGLVLIARYFSVIPARDRPLEQILSTVIFVHFFLVLGIIGFTEFEALPRENITSLLIVALSLAAGIFIPLKATKKYRGELAFIASPLLIAYGTYSYLFPNMEYASELWLYWIFIGAFFLDAGFRWYEDVDILQTSIVGAGIYIIFQLGVFVSTFNLETNELVASVLWMGFGAVLIVSRLVPEDYRERLYINIWNGMPFTLSLFFAYLGILLLMTGRYLEAVVEFILASMFIVSIIRSYEGWLKYLLWGLPLAVVLSVTLSSLVLF